MQAVLKDARIKGVNLSKRLSMETLQFRQGKLVIQGYADDLYFTTQNQKEVEFFLERNLISFIQDKLLFFLLYLTKPNIKYTFFFG